jgi:hypothetical protein
MSIYDETYNLDYTIKRIKSIYTLKRIPLTGSKASWSIKDAFLATAAFPWL